MPIQTDTINRGLYDLLTVRYDDVTPLDSEEKTTAPEEADIFRFTFEKDGVKYGKVYVTIDNSRNLVLYYGDEVEDSPDTNTSGTEFTDSWSGFRNMLKQWSQRKQLDFELKNKNHLAKDMAQRTYYKNKENLGESYYPMGKRGSYSDAVPNVKIIIQHTRQIGEGEQRYRNIDKIFVENTMGERFAVPSNKPGIAKVYARHIAEGGSPYDDRGRHITSLVEEYTKMAGFVRATKNKQFNESTTMLIQEGVNHYQALRETLGRMIGRRGYNAYFESWQPVLSEEITEEAGLNELFVQETIDPRIESVMPILSKLYKKASEMKEINQLEAWANKIIDEATDLKTIPEAELDEGKGAIRKFLAGLGILGALGAYISSEDEAILQKMAVKYDQAQTPQQKAQIKHDIERVTKGSLVKEDMVEEGLDTSWMNEKQKKFYDINPSFKDTSKEVVSLDKNKLATRVSPTSGIPKVGKKPITSFESQDMAEGKFFNSDYIFAKDGELWNKTIEGGSGTKQDPYTAKFNEPLRVLAVLMRSLALQMDGKDPKDTSQFGPTSNKLYYKFNDELYMGDGTNKIMSVDKTDHKGVAEGSLEEVSLDLAKRARDKAEYAVDMDYDDMRDRPEGYSEKQRSKFQRYIDKKEPRAKGDRDWDPPKQGMAEDLDANQKRVGQLGPYEKVGPQGAVGKLVGGESIREGQEDLDTIKRLLGEGLAGELAGGTLGGIAGNLAGTAIGGPIGGIVGGAVGGAGGGIAGRELTKEDQLNEFAFLAPALAAGARALLPLLSRAGPALGRMASTAGKAGAEVVGKAATGIGKGAVELGKSAVQSTAQNAGKVGLGAGIYSMADEIGKSIPQGLNKVYTDATSAASALTTILGNAVDGKTIGDLAAAAAKYAIPLGILLAVLYGGKKLIDQVMSEGADDTWMGLAGKAAGAITPNFSDFKQGFDKTFEGQEDLDTIRRLLGK